MSPRTTFPPPRPVEQADLDGRTAPLWDVVSRQELLSLKGHIEMASYVAVTPNCQRLVTGSEYGTASVWDAVTGREPAAVLSWAL